LSPGSEDWGPLANVRVIILVNSKLCDQGNYRRHRQTDRQTDRQIDNLA